MSPRQALTSPGLASDPRRSATASKARTHLAILPGTDWAFLLALIKVVLEEGLESPSTALPLTGLDRIRSVFGGRVGAPSPVEADGARPSAVLAPFTRRFAPA